MKRARSMCVCVLELCVEILVAELTATQGRAAKNYY